MEWEQQTWEKNPPGGRTVTSCTLQDAQQALFFHRADARFTEQMTLFLSYH